MAISLNGSTNVITGVAVGGLPDGIVDTDMLAANAVTAAKSSGLGITMVDTWRIITQYIGAQATLGGTSDWERDDTYGNGLLGTGMTQANGYFTFPSTGFYSVRFYGHHSSSYANSRSITGSLYYTDDNFSSSNLAAYYTVNCTGDSGAIIHGQGSLEKILDITDISNQKVKFAVGAAQNASAMRTTVDTTANRTYAVFTRLGDT